MAGVVGCSEASAPPIVSVPPPPPSASIGPPPPPAPVAVAPPPAPPIEGAPAPAKQAIDPKLKVEGGTLFLGSTPTEVWAIIDNGYTVVIDRATGCATEGYPLPKILANMYKLHGQALEAALKTPEALQGIRDMVGVGRRVGALGNRFVLDSVWSPDGRFIAFIDTDDHLHRSTDGGRSFTSEPTPRGRLAMSDDGKYLTYEEDHQYFSVPIDGSRPPKPFAGRQTFLAEMRPGAKAFFWRSDTNMCADIFDLATATLESSTCLPVPLAAATGIWPQREWESISPNGNYGIVKWEEGRPNRVGAMAATYVLALVEMPSKKMVKEVLDMRGEVDDGGNMVMSSMSEGGGDHTYYYPLKGERKLLGNHSLMAWRDKTAIMGVYKPGLLGARKCELVKMVKTP